MSRSLNEMKLIGNVGRDPEVKYTAGGKAICELSVATSRKDGEGKEHTEWHTVVLWGGHAEAAGRFARKGRQIYACGELRTDKWTDRQGIERWTTKIHAVDFFMLGAGSRSEEPPF
ncbi:MAG: single-stranded DNA-binding protein [Xanthomonadales bacterium]|nr:single-stranded DNA-binding protein [Xanthomonadales bacterium]